MQRITAAALFALLTALAGTAAHAQSTSPVVLPNGCGTGNATSSLSYLTVDSTLKLCVNATVTANVGATAQATLPTIAPGSGAALYESLSGGLYVNPIFGTTLVDATHGLPTNCISGCSGGTASNAGSGVATSSTNGTTNAWLYGFNGTTWDQLQVDGSKQLKVVNASLPLPTGAATSANQATEIASLTTIATNSGNPTKLLDGGGTNVATIKAASTAPATTDTSIVVAPNPNAGTPAPISQYPFGSTAVQNSTTGTTAATSTTLAATASVTNYVCSISIRANATATATGNATLSDGTKTFNYTQWTAPTASGLGVVEQIFNPCYPASAVNIAWTLTSAAPGTGGVVSVAIAGYQK